LDHGADIDKKENEHRTRSMFIFPVGISGRTPLYLATLSGNKACMDLLILHGADMTTKDEDGYTLLHIASRLGHIECVRTLLQHRLNINQLNNEGRTALHLASFWGNTECVRILLEYGVDYTLKDKYGGTALDVSGNNEIFDLIQRCIDGPDIKEPDV
jgi:ankyrin repeat protein